jgi:hypothetical protein
MAKRKSVNLSTRPIHEPSGTHGIPDAAVTGDFIPADAPASGREQGTPARFSGGPLAQAAYGVAYVISFGCVFSGLMISRVLPGQAILARGLGDGAEAAKRAATGFGVCVSGHGDRGSRADASLRVA